MSYFWEKYHGAMNSLAIGAACSAPESLFCALEQVGRLADEQLPASLADRHKELLAKVDKFDKDWHVAIAGMGERDRYEIAQELVSIFDAAARLEERFDEDV